jgi:tripartite-type tricarboxylate transporter receptor subunit TctC
MRSRLALAAIVVAAFGASPVEAQFYKGKTVTMMINFPPGGPTDIEGRIFARHLDRHIPGKPALVVKNVGGAAGNLGANQLGEQAARDGLTFGFFTWNAIDQMMGAEGLRVKFSDFIVLAGVQQPNVIYVRRDVVPGFTTSADITKAKDLKVGGLGPSSSQFLYSALSLEVLGVKFKPIVGYKGNKEIETALLQNEVHMTSSSLPGYRASIEPNLVKTGIAAALYHFDVEDADGRLAPSKALPDVPSFLQVYRSVHGPDKDDQFVEEYEKAIRARPALVRGEDGAKLIAGLAHVRPELVRFFRDYTAAAAR